LQFACRNKNNNKLKIKKMAKQKVKILGQVVTVGTKLHAKLVAQVKHFNDLSTYENN
jgi:hypothetical protein